MRQKRPRRRGRKELEKGSGRRGVADRRKKKANRVRLKGLLTQRNITRFIRDKGHKEPLQSTKDAGGLEELGGPDGEFQERT